MGRVALSPPSLVPDATPRQFSYRGGPISPPSARTSSSTEGVCVRAASKEGTVPRDTLPEASTAASKVAACRPIFAPRLGIPRPTD